MNNPKRTAALYNLRKVMGDALPPLTLNHKRQVKSGGLRALLHRLGLTIYTHRRKMKV